jgi:G:T-mismatch repair DNA endonuclease (very short patch repair protein)
MYKKYPVVFSEAKKKWQKAMNKSIHLKPNQAENKLLTILSEIYPKEWEYVGDWTMVLDGKSPDFVNINGKKLIIELFGDYWHRNDNPDDRIALFKKFGYRTLVIWERELKDKQALICKIGEFVKCQ